MDLRKEVRLLLRFEKDKVKEVVDSFLTFLKKIAGCSNPNWKGDNSCDDGNNNAGCDFDGGDCCGSNVDTTWCDDCECLDPEFCKDNYWGCSYWAGKGYCTHSYVSFMTSNCKKSCFC